MQIGETSSQRNGSCLYILILSSKNHKHSKLKKKKKTRFYVYKSMLVCTKAPLLSI